MAISSTSFQKGYTPWNKGIKGENSHCYKRKISIETKNRISEGIKKHFDKSGRKSKINQLARKNKNYQEWRKAVFKRDNYTCQKCGNNSGLHPHHIKSFANFKDLRYEINNGITLCNICHGKIHGIDFIKIQKLLECKNCKKNFNIKDGHYKQIFCSNHCKYQYRTKIISSKKGKKYPHLQRARIGNCIICNKEFRAIKDFKQRKQKYCSQKCYMNRAQSPKTNIIFNIENNEYNGK